jgi:hypothetical protein
MEQIKKTEAFSNTQQLQGDLTAESLDDMESEAWTILCWCFSMLLT